MKKSLLIFWMLLTLGVSLSYSFVSHAGSGLMPAADRCDNDSECASGWHCDRGLCASNDPCNNACDSNQYCDGGVCVTSNIDLCYNNLDCGGDRHCDGGVCVSNAPSFFSQNKGDYELNASIPFVSTQFFVSTQLVVYPPAGLPFFITRRSVCWNETLTSDPSPDCVTTIPCQLGGNDLLICPLATVENGVIKNLVKDSSESFYMWTGVVKSPDLTLSDLQPPPTTTATPSATVTQDSTDPTPTCPNGGQYNVTTGVCETTPPQDACANKICGANATCNPISGNCICSDGFYRDPIGNCVANPGPQACAGVICGSDKHCDGGSCVANAPADPILDCFTNPNPDGVDSDGDGIGDVCDKCPNLPSTVKPSKWVSKGSIWGNAYLGCPNGIQPTTDKSVDNQGSGSGGGGGACSLTLGSTFPSWDWLLFVSVIATFWGCRRKKS